MCRRSGLGLQLTSRCTPEYNKNGLQNMQKYGNVAMTVAMSTNNVLYYYLQANITVDSGSIYYLVRGQTNLQLVLMMILDLL